MDFNIEVYCDFDIESDIPDLIKRAGLAVLQAEKIPYNCTFDVTITDDTEIREMNFEYRQKDKATDVLSFPMVDYKNGVLNEDLTPCIDPETNIVHLGDMIISYERAMAQAKDFGHSVTREIAFLTVHSVLHLLGYDHEMCEQDKKLMQSKEKQVLESLGILRG